MYEHGFAGPAIALVGWTLVVWVWMYATRIPAMQAARIAPQDARFPGSLDVLPASARQVADNYNHLMEQPTIFYAALFAGQITAQADAINIGLAWSYVALRVAHSLVQCTINSVPLRFLIFALSTLVLMALAARIAWAMFA